MHGRIAEADWKILREIKPLALARFCDRVLAEVVAIASDGAVASHDRYLAVFKLIDERDGELARAFNRLSRSSALLKLTLMRSLDLVTEDEFLRFSAETREAIQRILGPRRNRPEEPGQD